MCKLNFNIMIKQFFGIIGAIFFVVVMIFNANIQFNANAGELSETTLKNIAALTIANSETPHVWCPSAPDEMCVMDGGFYHDYDEPY